MKKKNVIELYEYDGNGKLIHYKNSKGVEIWRDDNKNIIYSGIKKYEKENSKIDYLELFESETVIDKICNFIVSKIKKLFK